MKIRRAGAGVFAPGDSATHVVAPGRGAWIHVVRGSVAVNGTELGAGDAAAIDAAGDVTIEGKGGEVLVFDLS